MKRLNRPLVTQETIKAMEDMSFFTHAMIFDDLLIIAQRETSCFVLWTTDGLIIIDAIWPARPAFDAIVNAISDAGWGGCPVKKLLLTHGHVDHTGCGRWLAERYRLKTYLSETDDVFWQEHPAKPDRPETWKDYRIDCYIKDKDHHPGGQDHICLRHTRTYPGMPELSVSCNGKRTDPHGGFMGRRHPAPDKGGGSTVSGIPGLFYGGSKGKECGRGIK